MGDITRIDTVQQYCDLFEVEALHPLVSVVKRNEVQPIRHSKKLYNIYAVERYSRGRKREHSKVCIRQVTLSAGNPITAGFIGCRVPNFSSLSCIEISHFSKRCAGRCDKN